MERIILIVAFLMTMTVAIIFIIQCLQYFFKRRRFPKNSLLVLIVSFSILTMSWIYVYYFFTFDKIDAQYSEQGMQHVISPNEEWTANTFYEQYGGAAGGVNVVVKVTNLKTNETKTIYYANAYSLVSLSWENHNTLFIRNEDAAYENANASIALQVEEEIYDEFGLACQSILMKKQYKACYEGAFK